MTEIARVEMLAAIERLPGSKYRCRCDCGNERIVNVGHFNAGNTKSCGCTKFMTTPFVPGPCGMDGCNKPRVNNRGWCWQHYMRWLRHGDPLHTEKGKPQEWLDAHVDHKGDECLIWPFGARSNGYGTIVYDGEHTSAHRKMCELRNGPPPSPDHEASHSCGKGHLGCVHPGHLSWKTPVENQADKLIHGTHNRGERHPMAKLTAAQVLDARRRYRPYVVTCPQLAKEYGVSAVALKTAIRRQTWRWLNG